MTELNSNFLQEKTSAVYCNYTVDLKKKNPSANCTQNRVHLNCFLWEIMCLNVHRSHFYIFDWLKEEGSLCCQEALCS